MLQSIIFLIIVLVTGFILLNSPIFEVRKVLVRGNNFLDEEKILAVADIELGINIFKLKTADLTSNIKALPMIKETQVARSLPSSVVITVVERVPLGLLPAKEGFMKVDEEGVCLARAGAGTPGLPVITGVQADLAAPGNVLACEKLQSALDVIKELPTGSVANLTEIHVDEDGQIKIYTTEGYQCRFGLPQNIREKGQILQQVLLELRRQGAKINYIDLSYAGQPVVYYKNCAKVGD